MKAALAIYLFMLALIGGLAWHAGASPVLLVGSMLVVLLYSWLNLRAIELAEPFKRIGCALLVACCALQDGSRSILLGSCLLALPQLLSATQCLWEIQRARTARDSAAIDTRRSMFTLGFYSSMGLAFLLLRSGFFDLAVPTGRTLAVVCSLLGLCAWEASRAGRHKPGRVPPLTDGGFLARAIAIGLAALTFILLFAVALPLASEALCEFSQHLASKPSSPPTKPVEKFSTQSDDSAGGQPSDGLETSTGPEQANRTGQVELPMRGTLRLSDELRMVLRFEDPSQAAKLIRRGPLYIRSLAVSRFEEGEWVADSPSGTWRKDADDGRLDDRVEVGSPGPGDIAHEMFLLRSNGQSLPALAGVTAYGLQEVLVLPDDWFQNPATGDIRYKAWSRPLEMLSLSPTNPKAGNPGPRYLTRLDGPFGNRLSETAGTLATGRADLAGRIEALRGFFQTNFTYSKTVENPSNQAPLENFLFEEKKGYCDFFASASALMLRHMGIPSRVAYGYLEGEHDPGADQWIFREHHAHSWTEVFVEGQGWVICDFTPPSAASPPQVGTLPASLDLESFAEAGAGSLKSQSNFWNRAQSLLVLQSPWLLALLVLGWAFAILGLLFRSHRTPKLRSSRIAARTLARSQEQPDYFLEFLRMCQSFGRTRRAGQTLMEFHRELKQASFCHDDFDELADYYYKSRYEDAPRNRPSERQFLKRIRRFSKAKAKENQESLK